MYMCCPVALSKHSPAYSDTGSLNTNLSIISTFSMFTSTVPPQPHSSINNPQHSAEWLAPNKSLVSTPCVSLQTPHITINFPERTDEILPPTTIILTSLFTGQWRSAAEAVARRHATPTHTALLSMTVFQIQPGIFYRPYSIYAGSNGWLFNRHLYHT